MLVKYIFPNFFDNGYDFEHIIAVKNLTMIFSKVSTD